MSAKLATYDQTPLRWGTPPYTAVRCAARIRMLLANALALIGVGTMLALNPLGLQLALATDLTQPRTVARVAAIEGALEHFPYHASLLIRSVEVKADLNLLLAQSESSVLDGAARDDTILVAFALSEPYSIDEDIAAQHGLELIDRTELSSFGLRLCAIAFRPISRSGRSSPTCEKISASAACKPMSSMAFRPEAKSRKRVVQASASKPSSMIHKGHRFGGA